MTVYRPIHDVISDINAYLDSTFFIEFDVMQDWVEMLSECEAYESVLDLVAFLNEHLEAEVEPDSDALDDHIHYIIAETTP